eukprot:1974417-Prymnesium_polylepis.1
MIDELVPVGVLAADTSATLPRLPPPPSASPPPTNLVEENQVDVGVWGGTCTCPNGETYQVGDSLDYCGTLACIGGVSGVCNKLVGDWANRR